jgi:hypothetical protein
LAICRFFVKFKNKLYPIRKINWASLLLNPPTLDTWNENCVYHTIYDTPDILALSLLTGAIHLTAIHRAEQAQNRGSFLIPLSAASTRVAPLFFASSRNLNCTCLKNVLLVGGLQRVALSMYFAFDSAVQHIGRPQHRQHLSITLLLASPRWAPPSADCWAEAENSRRCRKRRRQSNFTTKSTCRDAFRST